MLQGKVQNALRYISRNSNGGVLKLDDLIQVTTKDGECAQKSTRDILKEKHPAGKDPIAPCLIDGEPETVNPITFDGLDADAIRQAAVHTHGAAGPSGLDAYAWRRLCSSFKSASSSLCAALSAVARRIATTSVNPEGLCAFVACRLIPLDKCPGVRPIGVGEDPRRIIAKAILKIIGYDVENAAGHFNFVQAKTVDVRLQYMPCGAFSKLLRLKLYFWLMQTTLSTLLTGRPLFITSA